MAGTRLSNRKVSTLQELPCLGGMRCPMPNSYRTCERLPRLQAFSAPSAGTLPDALLKWMTRSASSEVEAVARRVTVPLELVDSNGLLPLRAADLPQGPLHEQREHGPPIASSRLPGPVFAS